MAEVGLSLGRIDADGSAISDVFPVYVDEEIILLVNVDDGVGAEVTISLRTTRSHSVLHTQTCDEAHTSIKVLHRIEDIGTHRVVAIAKRRDQVTGRVVQTTRQLKLQPRQALQLSPRLLHQYHNRVLVKVEICNSSTDTIVMDCIEFIPSEDSALVVCDPAGCTASILASYTYSAIIPCTSTRGFPLPSDCTLGYFRVQWRRDTGTANGLSISDSISSPAVEGVGKDIQLHILDRESPKATYLTPYPICMEVYNRNPKTTTTCQVSIDSAAGILVTGNNRTVLEIAAHSVRTLDYTVLPVRTGILPITVNLDDGTVQWSVVREIEVS